MYLPILKGGSDLRVGNSEIRSNLRRKVDLPVVIEKDVALQRRTLSRYCSMSFVLLVEISWGKGYM